MILLSVLSFSSRSAVNEAPPESGIREREKESYRGLRAAAINNNYPPLTLPTRYRLSASTDSFSLLFMRQLSETRRVKLSVYSARARDARIRGALKARAATVIDRVPLSDVGTFFRP